MKDDQARQKEAERLEGRAQQPVPTYQELLDEAVDQTFPASDPISPGAARHADEAVSTGKDEQDWTLRPGADQPVPDDPAGGDSSSKGSGSGS